uniref:Uncharacterized protein n=1 Tax=Periophthalmus magnuspinnatus TaxID=409849 RepID=A0A3B4AG23_9GOBI
SWFGPGLVVMSSHLWPRGHVITLSSMYGSLESPNFPEPYPRDLDLVWDIRVQAGFRIRLDFSHFHLEPSYLCEYDYVKVEADGELLGLFCGSEPTDTEAVPGSTSSSTSSSSSPLLSPSSSLSITFRTDYSDEDRYTGFRAHYTAQDVDECLERSDEELLCDHFCHNFIGGFYCSCRHGYKLHPDNRTCTVHCKDVVFRESSGIISSPEFPGSYPKSSDCQYQIQVQTGFRVRLEFDAVFDVEDHPEATCPYDYVKVVSGGRELGPFCGSVAPGSIETESSSVMILFHSDNSGENQGWSLNYTTTGTKPGLDQTHTDSHRRTQTHTDAHRRTQTHTDLCISPYPYSCLCVVLCVAEVDCGNPPPVTRAQILFLDQNRTTFGSKVRYQCETEPGLNLSTSQSQTSEMFSSFKSTWFSPGSVLVLVSSGCGLSRSLPSLVKRIVGGRTADSGMFPWQVLLQVQDRTRIPEQNWFGSGSLLSETWVLTAAHVLRSPRRDGSVVPIDPQHIQVFLGVHSSSLKHQAQQRIVGAVVLHPDFQPQNYNHDIALLRLSSAAQLSDVIRPVCLPPIRILTDPPLPEPHTLGVVAGWGLSVTPDPALSPGPAPLTSDLLQFVKLPVVPQEECVASYASRSADYNISLSMFCAGYSEGGRDTCPGDSGGAFGQDQRWTVVGIVSWGGPEDCGSKRVYGVYTRVEHYRDWILQTMKD